MNKFLPTLFSVFAGLVVILVLLTALANSVASAASAAALLTSQCMAFFMVIVALVAGVVIGANALTFMQNRKANSASLPAHIFPSAQLPYPSLDLLALPAPEEDDEDELSQALVSLIKGSQP